MRPALLLGLLACGPQEEPPPAVVDTTEPACDYLDNDASSAVDMVAGIPATDTICPQGDQDWYRLPIVDGTNLLHVNLGFEGEGLTRLGLAYTLWNADATSVLAVSPAGTTATSSEALTLSHGVDVDTVLLQVHDAADDVSDEVHAYTLRIEQAADRDPFERNDTRATAAPLAPGDHQGWLSYSGDEDWYAIEATAGELIDITLTAPPIGYELSFELYGPDGTRLATGSEPGGTVTRARLRHVLDAPMTGTHLLLVSDDDRSGFDDLVPYGLLLAVGDDPDVQEPNDEVAAAHEVGTLSCGEVWTDTEELFGRIGKTGDIDWYAVDLDGCEPGLIEATARFLRPSRAPADLDLELRLVHATDQACTIDQDCQELDLSCGSDLDCEGDGNLCLGSGFCAGAGVCLPTGVCGSNQLIETEQTPKMVELSAPLDHESRVFVAVADQRGDALAADALYRLTLRTRVEPDVHEPNDVYTAGPPLSSAASRHRARATDLFVHDCTTGDCCDSDTWVEGTIASAYDQDWFRYEHPCPGGDCMLRVNYAFDAGPVDFLTSIYKESDLWFDQLSGTVDLPSQSYREGWFGGLDASDQCFYAYRGHGGSPYRYHLSIRDTIYESDASRRGGTWDWSATQRYRICVERIADGCFSPCQVLPGGCSP